MEIADVGQQMKKEIIWRCNCILQRDSWKCEIFRAEENRRKTTPEKKKTLEKHK